jgi:hypothetical protein
MTPSDQYSVWYSVCVKPRQEVDDPHTNQVGHNSMHSAIAFPEIGLTHHSLLLRLTSPEG